MQRILAVFRGRFRKDRLYVSSLIRILAVTLAMVSATAFLLTFYFERAIRSLLFSSALTHLEQTSRDASMLVAIGQELSFQIYSDVSIMGLLYYESPSARQKTVGLRQLANYQYIMPFVDSIYIYNAAAEQVFLSRVTQDYDNSVIDARSLQDRQVLDIIASHEEYGAYRPIPRASAGEGNGACYTFFGYDFNDKTRDGELLCAVILNISTDWIKGVIEDNSPPELGGYTIILDQTGTVISDSPEFGMQTSLSELPGLDGVIGNGEPGYMLSRWREQDVFVAYTAPDRLGWQYLRMIPYAGIVSEVVRIRNLVVVITGLVFALCALSVWLLNRAIQKPVDDIRDRLDKLQETQRRTFYSVKQDFLRGLILNAPQRITSQLKRDFAEYRVKLAPDEPCFLILIKIDGFREFCAGRDSDEQALCQYAITNLAEDILASHYRTEAVNMLENQILILAAQKDGAAPGASLTAGAERIRGVVSEILGVSVSMAIASDPSALLDAHVAYSQVRIAARFLFYKGDGSVIGAWETPHEHGSLNYAYPEREEKALYDSLMKGNAEEAAALCRQILYSGEAYPFGTVHIVISRLVLLINTVHETMQSTEDASDPFFFVNLGDFETMEALCGAFAGEINRISDLMSDKKGGKAERIAAAVEEVVRARYGDSLFGIESAAEQLELSANYLGRIYHQQRGRTILDYLMDVRMEDACRLLASTKEPVSSIAEKVGFSSDSYFYRVFKKRTGLTPALYRTRVQKRDAISPGTL